MRVLRVISSMKPSQGGPAQGIRNAIPEMKRLGIENEVLCFDSGREDYCGKDPFTIYYLGRSRGPYSYNAGLRPWLLKNVGKYDVVIIHGIWLYNSFGTYSAWKRYKKNHESYPRLFVMPHGMLDPYFQKAPDRRLKAYRNSVFWHLLEKHVINNVDAVLFTCQRELELARESFNDYAPKKEINVTYGIQAPPSFEVDMENAFFEKSGLTKKDPYFLFLSRIHSKKGVDLLIKSYISIKDGGQVENVAKLVIAGPLKGNFSKSLVDLTRGRDDIIFTGMLEGNAKWGALYLTEAFILPSHQENFGIAVAEALACGKPVLISDKVNIYKEILDGEAGFVEDDTEIGVVNLFIKWHKTDIERKETMKKNARNVFLSKFSILNSVRETVNKLHIQM